MAKQFLIPALIFIPVAILQMTVVPLISLDYIAPDLIIILLVFFSIKNGRTYGSILGFVFGIIFDFISGGLIGSAAFAKTIAGFTAGYFKDENEMETDLNTFKFVSIVFLCDIINSFFIGLLGSMEIKFSLTFLLFEVSLLPAIYTAVLSFSVAIFKPVRKII